MRYARHTFVRAAAGLTMAASLIGVPVAQAAAAPVDIAPVSAQAPKPKWHCKNALARTLYKAGFRGTNLREAWAIAMRESGGRARAVSSTHDYGLFQWNYAAWHGQSWWSTGRLLTPDYNARVAFRISRGGKTWYPWDIDGRGRHLGRYTDPATFGKFKRMYAQYPCAA